jgi:hypothetical protein
VVDLLPILSQVIKRITILDEKTICTYGILKGQTDHNQHRPTKTRSSAMLRTAFY